MSTLSDVASLYDEDYYERGVESAKSCYSNYRWLPELTVPMAMVLIDTMDIRPRQSVLDFGCAKGFTVKALRMLRRDASGIDISPYAVSHADPQVAAHVNLVEDLHAWALTHRYHHVIAKDVMEHVPHDALDATLGAIASMTDTFLMVVPLGLRGDHKRYVIEAYERDVTHIIREDASWWRDALARHFAQVNWQHHIDGLKDNWQKVHPQGNAVFLCRRPWAA
jgi:cyclopropane fatty-acyl-phospholipid synthase-like methyltransferase